MHEARIETSKRSELVAVTEKVADAVREAGIGEGIVTVYVPHTTAGVTVNENADPDVARDMLAQLEEMVPWRQPFYAHGEGNSAAHVKASLMGSSVTLLVSDGRLALGTWQGGFFCEFDGPRTRRLLIAPRG